MEGFLPGFRQAVREDPEELIVAEFPELSQAEQDVIGFHVLCRHSPEQGVSKGAAALFIQGKLNELPAFLFALQGFKNDILGDRAQTADRLCPGIVPLTAAVFPIRKGLPGKHHGIDQMPVGIGEGSCKILSGGGDHETFSGGLFAVNPFQHGGSVIREEILDKIAGFGNKRKFKAPAVIKAGIVINAYCGQKTVPVGEKKHLGCS